MENQKSGPVAFREGMTVSDACAEAMGYTDEANLKNYTYTEMENKSKLICGRSSKRCKRSCSQTGDRLCLKNLYGNKHY